MILDADFIKNRKSVYLFLSMTYLLFQVIQLVLLYYTCLPGFLKQASLVIYSSEELFLTLQDGKYRRIFKLQYQLRYICRVT